MLLALTCLLQKVPIRDGGLLIDGGKVIVAVVGPNIPFSIIGDVGGDLAHLHRHFHRRLRRFGGSVCGSSLRASILSLPASTIRALPPQPLAYVVIVIAAFGSASSVAVVIIPTEMEETRAIDSAELTVA